MHNDPFTRRLLTELLRAACVLCPCLLVSPAVRAQSDGHRSVNQLAPVIVTATRTESAAFDVPASIDRIDRDTIEDDRAQVNISESLGGVPGLMARDRQNYAQDVQISVRGFGARSTFGIRGVRLYIDGIPATFPDGQGQISSVDLGSADRIEVLRGPFSALYGNSSGGVLQVFTEDGAAPRSVSFGLSGGSNGMLRASAKLRGRTEGLAYVLSASHFETDGYRDHSAAQRNIGNAKLSWHPDEASTLTLVANSMALPDVQDPLGLTRVQFDADPRGVDPSALAFDTRKHADQSQGGLIYERRVDAANALRVLVYTGHRNTEQFQSIPVGPQANPLHPGGVIELGSDYRGTDLRWTRRASLAERPFTLVAGLAYDIVEQQRRGYRNYVGTAPDITLGVQGALRRDQNDTASDLDPYLQASLQLSRDWSVWAGLRHSSVRIESKDHYIVGTNGDDSGAARYDATLPVIAAMFALSSELHLYAAASRGFETPTLNELAYRPNGATGLNFDLRPARSANLELGLKARLAGLGELSAAAFATRTKDEIVTLSNVGGRSTYQNAGATRRTGLEIAWSAKLAENVRAQAALATIDAAYADSFLTCNASPCPAGSGQQIAAGNRIPGVARSSLYASLAWAPALGWRAGAEGRYLGRVQVNDANSDAAPSHVIGSAHVGYVARFGAWDVSSFARVDNLFDRRYAGSVIVNEGNGRYFEPAPGRTWSAGVSSTLRF